MQHNPHNILITGVAGFIGSNVLVHMVQKYPNYNIVGIDSLTYCSSVKNFREIDGADNFKFIKSDIKNLDMMDHIFNTYSIDTVMHFAAYSHVDRSFGNSIIFTENNVLGTHVLVEVANKYKVKRFIHVSTDEVYGSQAHSKSDEQTMLDPTNPYAATKAAAEHIVRSYHSSFNFPAIITRGNNVYGPKQYPEKVIPKFILKLLRDSKCGIHGQGNQLRSFLYIDDVVEAFDKVLHDGVVGEIYNIGCNDEYTVLEVAKKLTKLIKNCDEYEKWVDLVEDRCFNDQRYFISTEKLEAIGWTQTTTLDIGLDKTLKWYLDNLEYWDNNEINSVINK